MKEYQERVINEQNALDEKIERLTEFLKDTNSRQIVPGRAGTHGQAA